MGFEIKSKYHHTKFCLDFNSYLKHRSTKAYVEIPQNIVGGIFAWRHPIYACISKLNPKYWACTLWKDILQVYRAYLNRYTCMVPFSTRIFAVKRDLYLACVQALLSTKRARERL